MLRTALFICFSLWTAVELYANDPKAKLSRSEYIDMWKDAAMEQMKSHGIPASITLAQAILESGDGNSELARKANNHFGIKCHDWTGKKVYHDDDARNECFRKYGNARESFEDHSLFLKRARYAFLFDYEVTDYEAWAKGLKKAGYATNPKYPDLLIRLIEENNLVAYDLQAVGKMPKGKKTNAPQKGQSSGSGDEIVVTLGAKDKVFVSDNRIKYTLTESRETPESLAQKMNMGPWQIRRYNDFAKGEPLPLGTRVYLQPKRGKAAKTKVHVVQNGETLHDISQQYGVKLKRLIKRSEFQAGYEVKPGDKVVLR